MLSLPGMALMADMVHCETCHVAGAGVVVVVRAPLRPSLTLETLHAEGIAPEESQGANGLSQAARRQENTASFFSGVSLVDERAAHQAMQPSLPTELACPQSLPPGPVCFSGSWGCLGAAGGTGGRPPALQPQKGACLLPAEPAFAAPYRANPREQVELPASSAPTRRGEKVGRGQCHLVERSAVPSATCAEGLWGDG